MPRNMGSGSLVVELGAVCLVCLRPEPGYCSIYSRDLETPHMQIVDKIRSCSALQLDRPQRSQFPDKICHGCRIELGITYRFQQKCLMAQKVFQSATTAPLMLELEQTQQLKLPTSLKIKRLETETASSKVKYYNDGDDDDGVDDDVDSLTLIQPDDGATALVMQDVIAESSDNEDDKMLALHVDWVTEQTEDEEQREQQHCESEQDLELELDQEFDHEQELETEDDDHKLPDEHSVTTSPTVCIPVSSSNVLNVTRNRRTTEPKICDICGNTYKYQHALNAHMRRHNNDRPYPCEVCQKAFISNGELRRHMRVHTGQKPYSCHYCERRFSDFGSSKKHERIHTGERPYVCEVCNKGFAYAHVLSVHRRTHTGKKQFQCNQCEKGFTKKCYLATHLEHHRIDQPELREGTTATIQRLPTRKQQQRQQKLQQQQQKLQEQKEQQQLQQQQQQRERLQQQVRYDDDADEDDDYEDDKVSAGISMETLNQVGGEQAKVLEECIVTNDFMFNDEDADESEPVMDDYHDTELDDSEFQTVQHVKEPYELVTDLLDADDLVSDTKYLME